MITVSAKELLVSMANVRGTDVLDVTLRYNRFVAGEYMIAYNGAAVSNYGHTLLSRDDVSAILANNGFVVSADCSIRHNEIPTKHVVISDAEYRAGSGLKAAEEMKYRQSIRRNIPNLIDDVAGVTGEGDKPELSNGSTKPEIVPDLPPMPERKPKLVIHIEIDNNDLDNAVMQFDGTVIDAVEALYAAGKYNESMIKPIVGAAAMLVADDESLQQKFDELKVYFSNTPQHG